MNVKIEKKIWIFWYQGWDCAPYVIQRCKTSWIQNNPGWEINLIDIKNLNKYLNINLISGKLNSLSIAHKSDLVRLELLYKYGGVWVDASLFCLIPLDKWLYKYTQSGLFFFECYLYDIAFWFIAAEKNQPTLKLLKTKLINFWLENSFGKLNFIQKFFRKLASMTLNKNKKLSRLWLNPIFTKVIKIYPYQIFYFMFREIIRKDKKHKLIWQKTPKIDMHICWPHQESYEEISNNLSLRIKNSFVPLLKLSWKGYKNNQFNQKSLINELFQYQTK